MITVESPRPEKVLEKFPGILLKASNTDDAELGKLIKNIKMGNLWNSMLFMECWKIEKMKFWGWGEFEVSSSFWVLRGMFYII